MCSVSLEIAQAGECAMTPRFHLLWLASVYVSNVGFAISAAVTFTTKASGASGQSDSLLPYPASISRLLSIYEI